MKTDRQTGSGARFWAAVIAAVAALAAPEAARGQANWTGTVNTSWFNSTNWLPNAVPLSTTTAQIFYDVNYPPTRYCIVDGDASATGVCANLNLGNAPFTLNRIDIQRTLNVSSRVLASGNAKVNILATGVLTCQTNAIGGAGATASAVGTQGGTVTVGTEMSIGEGNGSSAATYNATGGTLTVNGANFWIGRVGSTRDGVGVLNVSGTAVAALDLHVGRGGSTTYNSKGTVTLSAGSLYCRNYYLGNSGNVLTAGTNEGLLEVSGGTFDVSSNYYNGFFRTTGSQKVYPTTKITGPNATFRVHGSYASLSNATLVAVLTGPNHTAIRVDGSVALDGTLKIATNGLYLPPPGSTWDLIVADASGGTTNALGGTFRAVDLSGVASVGAWRVKYDTAGKKVVLSLPTRGTLVVLR